MLLTSLPLGSASQLPSSSTPPKCAASLGTEHHLGPLRAFLWEGSLDLRPEQ